MYDLSNGTNSNDLEWAWRALSLLRVTKRVALSLCICRASCKDVLVIMITASGNAMSMCVSATVDFNGWHEQRWKRAARQLVEQARLPAVGGRLRCRSRQHLEISLPRLSEWRWSVLQHKCLKHFDLIWRNRWAVNIRDRYVNLTVKLASQICHPCVWKFPFTPNRKCNCCCYVLNRPNRVYYAGCVKQRSCMVSVHKLENTYGLWCKLYCQRWKISHGHRQSRTLEKW